MARNETIAAIVQKIPVRFSTAAELEKYKDQIMERDNTLVTGVFRNLERSGTTVKVPFRIDKKGFRHWYLTDNQEYTIPYALAIHLNEGCNTFEYAELNDPQTRSSQRSPVKAGMGDGGRYHTDKMLHKFSIPRFAFICADIPPRPQIIQTVKV